MIAFHNTTSRYMYALGGRACSSDVGVEPPPPPDPRTWPRMTQSALGLTVIVVYALAGWDPLVTLFYRGGTAGGLGVLLLIAATSIAWSCSSPATPAEKPCGAAGSPPSWR